MHDINNVYEFELESKNYEMLGAYRNIGYANKRHWHRHIEYHYVTKGVFNVCVDGKEYAAHEGDFVLIFPYSPHSHDETSCTRYLNIVNLDVVWKYNHVFLEKRLKSPVIEAQKLPKNILFFVKYIYDLMPEEERDSSCHLTIREKSKNLDEFLCRQNLYSAVNCLIGAVLRCADIISLDKAVYMDTKIDSTSRIMQYCVQNFSKDITLEQMSKDLYLNKYYISKVFSKNIGLPFNAFINCYRIDRCCEMLVRRTDKSIVDIMYECGFKNQGTFNALFKKIVHQTPNEFRKKKSNLIR